MPDAPAAETERLYALPLDEFTRERDQLAKKLRADGDREAAAAVKALKKPSVAAWAVNQVRRDSPDEVRRLLEVTEELHRVYAGLSAAGARERLGEAADMQRELVRGLVRCASQLLEAAGHAPAESTLTKVADTLRAAALDEELSEQIAAGRVVRERRAAGFGPLGSMPAPAKQAKKERKKGKPAKPGPKSEPEPPPEPEPEPDPPGPDPREVRKAGRAVEAARKRLETARAELEAAEERLRELARSLPHG